MAQMTPVVTSQQELNLSSPQSRRFTRWDAAETIQDSFAVLVLLVGPSTGTRLYADQKNKTFPKCENEPLAD